MAKDGSLMQVREDVKILLPDVTFQDDRKN